MKRILALHPSSELYGADRIFATVMKFYLEDNYTVDILLKQEGELTKLIQSETGIEASINKYLPIAVKSNLSLASFFRFFRDIVFFQYFLVKNRKAYDILYVNTLSLFVCSLLGRISGINKIIVHSHEIISDNGLISRVIISIAEYFSDKIICVSDAVKTDMLSASYPKSMQKYHVVHNGITDIRGNTEPQPASLDTKLNILLLGRLMPEKGQWFVLDSIKLLDNDVLDKISIQFVGGPPPYRTNLLNDLRAKIKDLDLQGVVEVIDFTDNPTVLINRCDICIAPSLMKDPFPTTVLEAMACSKPIITTNNGGAKEIVDNQGTGILITPGNTQQFRDALLYFLNNPDEINMYGVRGRNKYLNYLTLDHFKKRLLKSFGS